MGAQESFSLGQHSFLHAMLSHLIVVSATVASAELYCPSANDLTIAYCDEGPDGDMPCPQLHDQGWTILGGGGVASKSAFNLNGGFVEFDIDVSKVDYGVNANIYTIAPEHFASDSFTRSTDYCDGAASGSGWCMEEDWIESNGHCGGATTLHTKEGPGPDGCTAWGCATSYHYNQDATKFHMRVEYDMNGHWTVTRDGTILDGFYPVPDSTAEEIVKDNHLNRGVVIYSSQWTGWVPADDCQPKTEDLYGSTYVIQNLTISGTVVKGGEPTKCSAAIAV